MTKLRKVRNTAITLVASTVIGSGIGAGAAHLATYGMKSAESQFELHQKGLKQSHAQEKAIQTVSSMTQQIVDEIGLENFLQNGQNMVDEQTQKYMIEIHQSGILQMTEQERTEWITARAEHDANAVARLFKITMLIGTALGIAFTAYTHFAVPLLYKKEDEKEDESEPSYTRSEFTAEHAEHVKSIYAQTTGEKPREM